MRVSTRAGAVVCGIAALALVSAGCSGGSNSGSSGGSGNGAITIDGSEPQNPLVPGNTNETGGGNVVDAIFAKLVRYAPKDSKPENEMADSITTKDSKVYTIKFKKGWKFSDGTEVKTKNFIDAWNWVAYAPNGALDASFFSQIQGYSDVNPDDPDGDGPKKAPAPKAPTMSGLKSLDDYSFQVTLNAPFSVFPIELGYTAFAPLPDVFFKDPKGFGQKPVGNGPFKFVSWEHKSSIKITRNDDYPLAKPKVKDVTFKLYQSLDTAYADLTSNNLDFLETIPTADLVGEKWKSDLGTRALQRDVGVIQFVAFPLYDAQFKNPKLRQAISEAINRDEIVKSIFNNSRKPATGWVSPAVDGYSPGACGEFCTYNVQNAQALLKAAGGFTGKLTLAYNTNGGHKEWVEAACNSITTALGIDCKPKAYTEFADFRTDITNKQM
ncbi:MAG: peptide transporter substrate-binding protein, partial [Actinomycetia bacterium]|nr:peptide transporter substrate-binding protein [Actinomycetes bacterium]